MSDYVILVTGSRDWRWLAFLNFELYARARRVDQTIMVRHGAAEGADTIAANYAERRGWKPDPHPVLPLTWKALGKRAGHIRNQHMVNLGADLCLAFIRDHSKGATGCADLAEEAGIKTVRRYDCECHDEYGRTA